MTTALQPILIDGAWQASSGRDSFQATNPAVGDRLPDAYPVSDRKDLLAAVQAGKKAAAVLRRTPPERLAAFLMRYAALIEMHKETLAAAAHLETALPIEPRLHSVELPRTVNQLRQAAQATQSRSWTRPTIDTANRLRSLHAPLGGSVVVFGPNNFPFAFNALAGGDFAAAIAAGNPVIAKAHPGHPGTTRQLADLALTALTDTGLPGATVQLLYALPDELGLELVAHPDVAATAFTGSRRAGLALKAAADRAGKLMYAEMSSVNPVFLLPGSLEERADEIANEFFAACTLGAGQFCTNPGLVVLINSEAGEQFTRCAATLFELASAGVLLSESGQHGFELALQFLQDRGAECLASGTRAGAGYRAANTLLRVSGQTFLGSPHEFQTEAFGPAALVVLVDDEAQLLSVAAQLEGSLTGTIYSHSGLRDDALYDDVEGVLRPRVGRLLNDRMPTGVTVSFLMVIDGAVGNSLTVP